MVDFTSVIIGTLGVVVGAIIQIVISNIKIYENNIIKERKEWRDKIRCLTSDLNGYKPNYTRIKAEFQTRLNLQDEEDQKIVNSINKLIEDKDDETLNELNQKVSYLLKHDWDRVKFESNKFSFFPGGAIFMILLSISIFLQEKLNHVFPKVQIIRKFSETDLFYCFITTIFLISGILIMSKIITSIFPNMFNNQSIYPLRSRLYKKFKIPLRKVYIKKTKNLEDKYNNIDNKVVNKDIDEYRKVINEFKTEYTNMKFNKEDI